jgi:hypothetical protein
VASLLGALGAVLLAGCAASQAEPAAAASAPLDAGTLMAERAFAVWQRRLDAYVAHIGQGDAAVLAQQTTLRSAADLRPAPIRFSVSDIEALVPGRDGYDATGVLLGKLPDRAAPTYVFIVGLVERQDERPRTILDVRVLTMSIHDGASLWAAGTADAQALALYLRHVDTATTLRFPGRSDRFALLPCGTGVCVEERRSGARWHLD